MTHPARPRLLRAMDRRKDQTYYLSSISERSLERALFPIGNYTKSQVRELAYQYKLFTVMREESMGVCFVGERRKFHDFLCTPLQFVRTLPSHLPIHFLAQYIPPNHGPILHLTTGEQVGVHRGLWTFTIGQGAKVPGMSQKMYVARKDVINNTIYVVHGSYVGFAACHQNAHYAHE